MLAQEIIEDLNNFSKQIMEKENITDYSLKIEGQSEIGENYGGEVIFFNITGKNKENKEKIYNLVMKTAIRSEVLREKLPEDMIYNREQVMYSKIFPKLKTFCQEMNPNFSFDMIPKTFLVVDEPGKESVILENMKTNGYKLHEKKKMWNLKHSLFAMKNYGKYHGISFALKEKRPEVFKELFEILPNMSREIPGFDIDKRLQELLEPVMTYLEEIGRNDLVNKYSGIAKISKDITFGRYDEEHKTVITHGDCWNNNFMFKYLNEDESVPSKMCFLDFQLSCVHSPIIDLSYNIYTTCGEENLKNFDLLLKTYHESLMSTMKDLGCVKKPISLEDLRNQWKKYAIYGLMMATTLVKISLISKENAPNLVKDLEAGVDLQNSFNIKITNVEEFKKRILEIYIHYGDNFL